MGGEQALLFAAVDHLAISRQQRHENQIYCLEDEGDKERDDTASISGGDKKAGEPPEISRLFYCGLGIARIKFLDLLPVFSYISHIN